LRFRAEEPQALVEAEVPLETITSPPSDTADTAVNFQVKPGAK
jgi:hypothetical protein